MPRRAKREIAREPRGPEAAVTEGVMTWAVSRPFDDRIRNGVPSSPVRRNVAAVESSRILRPVPYLPEVNASRFMGKPKR
jgi:hypothetical protein